MSAAFGILLGVGPSSFKRIYSCDIGVYQTVKDVNASYDTLVELFEYIERFLGRLKFYANITLSEAMKDIVVRIMVEVISTLALATKQVKQGPLSKSCPRSCCTLTYHSTGKPMKILPWENEIEAGLKRLGRLTQDEARANGAQILGFLYRLVQHKRRSMEGKQTALSLFFAR